MNVMPLFIENIVVVVCSRGNFMQFYSFICNLFFCSSLTLAIFSTNCLFTCTMYACWTN